MGLLANKELMLGCRAPLQHLTLQGAWTYSSVISDSEPHAEPLAKRPRLVGSGASFMAATSAPVAGGKYRVGQRVEVRDAPVAPWLPGEVTSVTPLLVQVDGWDDSLEWKFCR